MSRGDTFGRRHTTQPVDRVTIDLTNPITDRLVGAWLPGPTGGLYDVSGRIGSLVNSGSTRVAWTHGLAQNLSGSSQSLTATGQSLATATPLTFAVWLRIGAAATSRVFDISTGSTADDVLGILIIGNDLVAQHYDGAENGIAVAAGAASANVGKWIRVAATFRSNASRQLYINGVEVATNSLSMTAPSGVDRVNIGYAPWIPGEYLNGRIAAPMLWRRVLAQQELRQDAENCWAVFSRRNLRFQPHPAGGPTVPTLSGATAFNVTATTARPRVTITF